MMRTYYVLIIIKVDLLQYIASIGGILTIDLIQFFPFERDMPMIKY